MKVVSISIDVALHKKATEYSHSQKQTFSGLVRQALLKELLRGSND